MTGERPAHVRIGCAAPERVPEVERRRVVHVEELPEGEAPHRRPAAARQLDVEREAQRIGRAGRGDGQVVDVPSDPERLEVGDRSARGEVSPRSRLVISDHSRELSGNLELEPGRDRRRLRRDVVRVVEHRGEIPDLAGDRLLEEHVPLVATAEERHVALELGEEAEQLLRERCDGVLVALAPLVELADGEAVLGVEIPPPEDVVPQCLDDESLEERRILGTGAEEP